MQVSLLAICFEKATSQQQNMESVNHIPEVQGVENVHIWSGFIKMQVHISMLQCKNTEGLSWLQYNDVVTE